MRLRPLGILLTACLTATAAAQGPWKVGRPIPELRLPTLGGDETIDLAELRGKKLILIEFASW